MLKTPPPCSPPQLNCNLSLVFIACERPAKWITIEGLIGEVLKWICIVHTFAASSGTNMWAMDLFEKISVFAVAQDTAFDANGELTSGRTCVRMRWMVRQTMLSPHASS
jgi:hypothetical protein